MKLIFKLILLFTMSLFSLNSYSANKVKTHQYTGDPITISLNVNKEQRITFPDTSTVWFDVKPSTEKKLTFLIANKDLLITPNESFEKARVIVGDEKDPTNIYFLDLVSTKKPIGNKGRIVINKGKDPYTNKYKPAPKKKIVNKPINKVKKPIKAFRTNKSRTAGVITLNRFAVHQLYAPERLRMKNNNIYKRPIARKYVHNLIRGEKYKIRAEASWSSGKLYVTALSVVNQLNKPVTPDVRNIRGQWRSMMFKHEMMSEFNTPYDSTTLFLVSNKPFKKAVLSDPIIKY